MKKVNSVLVSILVFAGMAFFVSCDQRSDAEKNRVEEQVEVEIDSIQIAKNEWEAYKTKILNKIADNELKIQEIQDKIKGKGGAIDKVRQSRIDDLKKRNQDLRAKLDSWTSDYSKWEEFKYEVDKSMEELDTSVRDFLKE